MQEAGNALFFIQYFTFATNFSRAGPAIAMESNSFFALLVATGFARVVVP
jgi:hypothetical protein